MLTWSQRFAIKEFLLNSLWLVPVLGLLVGTLAVRIVLLLDNHIEPIGSATLTADSVTTLLTVIFGAMISFTGFVLTILVLVVQFTGGSFSPRVLLFVFRDSQLKITLAFFIGIMSYTLVLLTDVSDTHVPSFAALVAGTLSLISVLLFLQFLSHLLHRIRPAKIADEIASKALHEIKELYPRPAPPDVDSEQVPAALLPDSPPNRTVINDGQGLVLQAVDTSGLVQLASKHDALFVLRCPVGEFVYGQGPVLEIYGEAALPSDADVRGHLAFGADRTVEQDPAFALRVLVDVSIKALSPAINDPTTGEHLLDRVEDVLSTLVVRDLHIGVHRDANGTLRLIYPTPSWEDYLRLGVTEIRLYGASNPQISRRLGALLSNLLKRAPEYRRAPIQAEIERLRRSVEHGYSDLDDREFAAIHDASGIGTTLLRIWN